MSINLVSCDVIKGSGVTFGTSGARGLVEQFSSTVCAAFSSAFIASIQHKFRFKSVAIAVDNRPSSYAMAQACAAVLSQFGVETNYYGVVPTPALALISKELSIPAIMVTGSHIPFDRNGLKFYRPDGEITKADEQVILSQRAEFSSIDKLPDLVVNHQAATHYVNRYTSLFKSSWLAGKRIGIYEHSSAGRDIYRRIFGAFGAEVISLGRSDDFVPIDTEAVAEADIKKALNWSKEYDLDIVFSTDGDGDRPLVSDENGVWLRGDILGLLASKALQIEALAIPISCNSAVERCGYFSYIDRTKIGSPYVLSRFSHLTNKYTAIAGFEANGGYLLGSDVELNGNQLTALPTRDAVLPVLMLLLAAQDTSISELVRSLPRRYTYSDRLQGLATEKSLELISKGAESPKLLLEKLGFDGVDVREVDTTDGLRLTLTDERILHLRPSGNAPELRCYSESSEESDAKYMVQLCLENAIRI